MQPKTIARSLAIAAFITAIAMGSTSGIAAADTPHPADTPTAAVLQNGENPAVAEHFRTAKPFSDQPGTQLMAHIVVTEVQPGKRSPNKVAECYQAQGGDCNISQSIALQASVNSTVGVV
ncbi:hypothetical protein [Pseudonocardia sp. ICBG601]|uniref:hypothetical protein n=1 Tax=Pseudonocardia sp. ICBG601 TaxID=2846759 RepID=UPI001CF69828|nr:hypothetical protein [Pseudonocardia sp. ICBG601]